MNWAQVPFLRKNRTRNLDRMLRHGDSPGALSGAKVKRTTKAPSSSVYKLEELTVFSLQFPWVRKTAIWKLVELVEQIPWQITANWGTSRCAHSHFRVGYLLCLKRYCLHFFSPGRAFHDENDDSAGRFALLHGLGASLKFTQIQMIALWLKWPSMRTRAS